MWGTHAGWLLDGGLQIGWQCCWLPHAKRYYVRRYLELAWSCERKREWMFSWWNGRNLCVSLPTASRCSCFRKASKGKCGQEEIMQIRGPQRPTICGVQIFGGFFSVRNVKLSLPWWIAQFEAERRFFLLFQYHSAIYNYMKYLRSTKSSVSDIFTEVNLLLNDQFVTEGIQIRH